MGIEILACVILAWVIISFLYWILKPFMNTTIEFGEKIAPYTLMGRLTKRARRAVKENDTDKLALCTLFMFLICLTIAFLLAFLLSRSTPAKESSIEEIAYYIENGCKFEEYDGIIHVSYKSTVWSEPHVFSERIGKVYPGEDIVVVGKSLQHQFYQIEYNGEYYYLSAQNVIEDY